MQLADKAIFGLFIFIFALYVNVTSAAYGFGPVFAGALFLLIMGLDYYRPKHSFNIFCPASIDLYGRLIVTGIAIGLIVLFWHSVTQNPYRHMIMAEDAAEHIQWPIAISREWTVKIATFSWPKPPEEVLQDPVFGYSFLDRSAHVFYFYGYFLSGILASLFFLMFPITGHHILVIACTVYVLGTYAIYKYVKAVGLKTPVIVAFCLLWAVNPMMIVSIFNGGRYEFLGFAFLPLFFFSILQKKIGFIFLCSFLLAGISRFYCYYILAACFTHLALYRQPRVGLALFAPALIFLAFSTIGFEHSIGESFRFSVLPHLNTQPGHLLKALGYNSNLLIFLFAYTGFAAYAAFRIKEDRKYAFFLMTMLAIGFSTLLARSYDFAFTRNCVIIIPIFYLAALGWRNIASERLQMLAVPIFLLFLAALSTLTWAWPGPNMLYHWRLSEDMRSYVKDLDNCSQFVDHAVIGKEKVAVSAPRSVEGAFLSQPNRWFFDWRQEDTDSFVIIEINKEAHLSTNYLKVINHYLSVGKIKKTGTLVNQHCSASIYERTH